MTLSDDNQDTRRNESILLRQEHGSVAQLTLNRPEARNALNEELLSALLSQIEDISRSPSLRALIVAANGPVFCSGHDIRQLESHRGDADGGKAYFETVFQLCAAMMKAILSCPIPVIAAVEGPATAAGCQLVATCDLAIASNDAEFCTPGVHIGLFCSTPAVALARNVGRKRAMEMLLLGEMVSAEGAREFGLVNRIAPRTQVRGEAMDMANIIASKSRPVTALGKAAFYDQFDPDLAASYERATRVMVENMMMEDAREGLSAFLDKREPEWRDA